MYSSQKELFECDYDKDGVRWLQMDDADRSVVCFARCSTEGRWLLFIGNWTPVVYYDYRVEVPKTGKWREILNSDDVQYGGSGVVSTSPSYSYNENEKNYILISLPPLGASFWICED